MSLPNVTFSNDKGSFSLTRVMYSISHGFAVNGSGASTKSFSISISGKVKTTDDEIMLGALSQDGGGEGSLIMPHRTYSRMRIDDISFGDGIWAPWGDVTVRFRMEKPSRLAQNLNEEGDAVQRPEGEEEYYDESSDFSITLNLEEQYTLYNPNINIMASNIRTDERAIHMEDGWLRQQMGHEVMNITISGSVKLPLCESPMGLVEAIEKKQVDERDAPFDSVPLVAQLSEWIPEASVHLNANDVILSKGRVSWSVDTGMADVSLTFVAPPQEIIKEEESE